MSYKVNLEPHARHQILKWPLSNQLVAEVYLRVTGDLADEPWRNLVRTEQPFDGMTFAFGLVDPENRLCEHFFAFEVVYGMDETNLYVTRGSHVRRTVGE